MAVFENPSLDKVLIIDDRIQLTSRDEAAYHEMFVHVPVIAHGAVKKVLIIGGGDGATLRETLKHSEISVTLVDIDAVVIEFSKKYLPTLHKGSFDNPRARVIIDDGVKFVRETEELFDVILIDSTDPEEDGPSSVLYSESFYASCKSKLTPGGIMVTQNGHPQWEAYPIIALSHLCACFGHVTTYNISVPTYLGGIQTFGWGCDDATKATQAVEVLKKRWVETQITDVSVYSPSFHMASFYGPLWLDKMTEEAHKICKERQEKK